MSEHNSANTFFTTNVSSTLIDDTHLPSSPFFMATSSFHNFVPSNAIHQQKNVEMKSIIEHFNPVSSHKHIRINTILPQGTNKQRRHRKQPHELLTEEQKKENHIASEQKRRQNIKIGFNQLIDIVPSLNHGNRSEALILQKSVEHIQHLINSKNELKNQLRQLQEMLGDIGLEEESSEDDLTCV
ncbi:uncharacterized protein BX663DRAFT_491608 [Cokeromyces recurvatus]|uniref:uncharacterized protein n=1 Tax=Cokeromyces recurvatus TaxID=90255 RepID=UPI002220D9F0|nr:uncharacterized protein BX663DRAFT_491608 [Cokeromyces recurvatus]KAI7907660.1 hypothetical protein BX663DRAFT_491608 [Cokeromyces recurvatus]